MMGGSDASEENMTDGKANTKPASFSLTVCCLGSGDRLRIVQDVAASRSCHGSQRGGSDRCRERPLLS